MKPLLSLLLFFWVLKASSQIPVPAGFGCTDRGFCKDSIYLSTGKLPQKTRNVAALQQCLEKRLNGTFRITADNLVTGNGYNSVERCYWVAAASVHSGRFIIALCPHKDAAFRNICSWLLEEAREAAARSRRWDFVDAAGRYCHEGLLERD